jgi:N-acetylglucosamine malate deacetylase 1
MTPNSAVPLDVLVIATHPDDGEIGVGGTLVRCGRAGLRTGILDLTNGEPTPHGSPELRAQETLTASAKLGIAWRKNLGLPNRSVEATLDARRALAGVLRVARPRIVFAPYWDDSHPDHVAASRLCEDARFWAKLSRTDLPGEPFWPPRMFYYWSVHLRIHPKPAFVIDISDAIEEKMQAVAVYESQFVTGRTLTFPTALDDIRDRARYWGWTIGKAYAEPFGCREEIGLKSPDDII